MKLEALPMAIRESEAFVSQSASQGDIVASGDGWEGEVISGRNDSAVQAPEFFIKHSRLQRKVS